MTDPSTPSPTCDVAHITDLAQRIRLRVFEHVLRNRGGYLSQALSSAEILALLYGAVLRLGPVEGPRRAGPFQGVPGPGNDAYTSGARFNGAPAPDRDRFLFSPAHYALVLYATLIEAGRLDEASLEAFNQDGSTMEMIGAEHSPGIETTTGSLAQALSHAAGIALGRSLRGHSGRTWVFMSDGEFQEGQTYEALAFASFHRLANLRAIVDVNGQQCDGRMDAVMHIEPLAERVRAFGCDAVDVNGHDVAALHAAMGGDSDRPRIILARTDPTRGVPLLRERAPLLHTLRFSSEDERRRYAEACEQMREAN